jgi:hypothetical protein
MTTQAVEAPQVPDAVTDASPWERLLALSGVAFAPLFVVGWLTSAVSDSPNYIAAQQKWNYRVLRLPTRHRRVDVADANPSALDRVRRVDRSGLLLRHPSDDPQQLGEWERVRLCVLPGHALARGVDGGDEHRQIPRRGGGPCRDTA